MDSKRVLVYVPEKQDTRLSQLLMDVVTSWVKQNGNDITIIVSELNENFKMSKKVMEEIIELANRYDIDEVMTLATSIISESQLEISRFVQALACYNTELAVIVDDFVSSQITAGCEIQIEVEDTKYHRANYISITIFD